jgi:hypothetical protein
LVTLLLSYDTSIYLGHYKLNKYGFGDELHSINAYKEVCYCNIMQKSYKICIIALSILSVIMASTSIMNESFADHPASKKLNDRASGLDKESDQAKKDGNNVKSFAKSLTAKKLREKA